jgi:hypothetical protein
VTIVATNVLTAFCVATLASLFAASVPSVSMSTEAAVPGASFAFNSAKVIFLFRAVPERLMSATVTRSAALSMSAATIATRSEIFIASSQPEHG